jgi:hypothetical protein
MLLLVSRSSGTGIMMMIAVRHLAAVANAAAASTGQLHGGQDARSSSVTM